MKLRKKTADAFFIHFATPEGKMEEAGSRIAKVAGSARKREKLRNIAQYFAMEKCKEAGANKYRAGTGIKR